MDNIYQGIADLSKTTTQRELTEGVQRVLQQMAFYLAQTDAVRREDEEKWHIGTTEAFRREVGDKAPGAATARRGHGGAAASAPPRRSANAPAHSRRSATNEMRGRVSTARAHAPPPAQHHVIPPSLRPIMDGSHASFQEPHF